MSLDSRPTRFAPTLNTEINVTPMIDVLLVLLIIFMAAIPSMRRAIDVQLPDPNPVHTPGSPSIVLQLHRDGAASINGAAVPAGGLAARLRQIYDGRPDKVLFVKGDPSIRYATVVEAMDVARGAGVTVIGWP